MDATTNPSVCFALSGLISLPDGPHGARVGHSLQPLIVRNDTTFDTAVRLGILRAFLDGAIPSVSSIAASLDAPESEVRAGFERLAAGRAIVLTPGSHRIRMAAPFAGEPTEFRATVAGRVHYANCIWDAMGVPAMLGASEAQFDTVCGDCHTSLRLDLRDGRMTGEDAVVHFAVPAARWWEDIVFT